MIGVTSWTWPWISVNMPERALCLLCASVLKASRLILFPFFLPNTLNIYLRELFFTCLSFKNTLSFLISGCLQPMGLLQNQHVGQCTCRPAVCPPASDPACRWRMLSQINVTGGLLSEPVLLILQESERSQELPPRMAV